MTIWTATDRYGETMTADDDYSDRSLSDVIGFDSPFRVLPGREVEDDPHLPPDVHYWEVVNDPSGDVTVYGDWTPMTGYTGQHGYSGAVMHPSEHIGGRLTETILDTPGVYVVTEVQEETGEDVPLGWSVIRWNADPVTYVPASRLAPGDTIYAHPGSMPRPLSYVRPATDGRITFGHGYADVTFAADDLVAVFGARTSLLTPYDTGAIAEPKPWDADGRPERSGWVDFDDDSSETLATVRLVRNPDGTHTLHVDTHGNTITVQMEV